MDCEGWLTPLRPAPLLPLPAVWSLRVVGTVVPRGVAPQNRNETTHTIVGDAEGRGGYAQGDVVVVQGEDGGEGVGDFPGGVEGVVFFEGLCWGGGG